MNALITIQNCRIDNSRKTLVQKVDWTMNPGENWLVIGPNGGGKADFLNALAGTMGLKFSPNAGETVSLFANSFGSSTEIVSLERAAKVIQEERDNDESDYVEGGVDIGRTARMFIAQALWPDVKKGKPLPPQAYELDNREEIKLTGIQKILDRGLKYLSTGEIRRTLLARALICGKKLLILSDPFAGLDVQSRKIIFDFLQEKTAVPEPEIVVPEPEIVVPEPVEGPLKNTPLVQMTDVNVSWGENHVLRNLNWTVNKGEHWLIQGPNGSGKTTLLELITGDNMQVFCNDVKLFGNKRGSGETIWDIKKKLGIVSYRLHVEYRMLGGTSLLNVIISGFRDSIGLYEAAKDTEIALAKKWLAFGGFSGRENESFGNLSYGEQRAILILRSAVKTPSLLILDEPCHGLDESFRTKVLRLMELIGEGGTTTMLHVTHDPSEILPCEKHVLQLCPDENPMYRIQNILLD